MDMNWLLTMENRIAKLIIVKMGTISQQKRKIQIWMKNSQTLITNAKDTMRRTILNLFYICWRWFQMKLEIQNNYNLKKISLIKKALMKMLIMQMKNKKERT